MIYAFRLTIPANTLETAPSRETVRLTHGIIHRLEIEFPAGCAGLAHCKILRGLHQVWPTNPDGDFASDDHAIAFDTDYPLTDLPTDLILVGWNVDDTFPHTLTFRIGMSQAQDQGVPWEQTPLGAAVMAALEEGS